MTNTDEQVPDTAKWYTRARRFPQLIGKTAEGTRIWGGPYTYTQAIVGPAFAVIGYKTMWLWGRLDLVSNAVILVGATIGIVVLLGKIPVGSRNPLSVAAGALHALSSPSLGRYNGAPLRPNPSRRCRGRTVVLLQVPTLAELQAAATKTTQRHPRRTRALQPTAAEAVPRTPARLRPTPADIHPRPHPSPALTGVQRALAGAGHRQES